MSLNLHPCCWSFWASLYVDFYRPAGCIVADRHRIQHRRDPGIGPKEGCLRQWGAFSEGLETHRRVYLLFLFFNKLVCVSTILIKISGVSGSSYDGHYESNLVHITTAVDSSYCWIFILYTCPERVSHNVTQTRNTCRAVAAIWTDVLFVCRLLCAKVVIFGWRIENWRTWFGWLKHLAFIVALLTSGKSQRCTQRYNR